jgi:serine/threonine protein kinase
MLKEWAKDPDEFGDGVFVMLTSKDSEFEEVGRCLFASKESEIRERLRRIGITEYLLLPLSLEAMQGAVVKAVREHCCEEFLLLDQLGVGATGIVHMTKRLRDGAVFALKQINVQRRSKRKGGGIGDCLEQEIISSLGPWPSVLRLVDTWIEDGLCYLLTPVMEGGNMRMQMTQANQRGTSSPPLDNVVSWYAQTLHGVCFLHSSGILHRDMKPENLILGGDGTRLCICDFGSAGKLMGSPPHPAVDDHLTGGATTTSFNAPEVLRERKHYAGSDVWSVGFTFYSCLSLGTLPNDEILGSFETLNAGLLNAAVHGIVANSQHNRNPTGSAFSSLAMLTDMVTELLETLRPNVYRRPTAANLAGRHRTLTVLDDILRRRMDPVSLHVHWEQFGEIRRSSELAAKESLVKVPMEDLQSTAAGTP